MPLVLYEVASSFGPVAALCGNEPEVLAFRFEGQSEFDLATLRKFFPEKGEFHFRAKTQHPSKPDSFAWVDLVKESDPVPRGLKGAPPHVRALPINIDSEDETDTDGGADFATTQHYVSDFQPVPDPGEVTQQNNSQPLEFDTSEGDDMDFFFASSPTKAPEPPKAAVSAQSSQAHTSAEKPSDSESSESEDSESDSSDESENEFAHSKERDEPPSSSFDRSREQVPPSSGGGVGGASSYMQSLGSKAFGASVSSFFKKSAKAAMAFANGEDGLPNTHQKGVLSHLYRKLVEEKWQSDDREHVDFLKTIWRAAFPNQPFQREGAQWQLIGFSSDDPIADPLVRKTGTLGIQCLSYHMEHTFSRSNPFENCTLKQAPLVIKIAYKIAKFLSVPNRGFESQSRPYWAMLNSGLGGFLEVVSVGAKMAEQKSRSSSCSDSVALVFAVEQLQSILGQGPKSIDSFYSMAKATGAI